MNPVALTTYNHSTFPCFLLFASDQSAHNGGQKCQGPWREEASFSRDESHWYIELSFIHAIEVLIGLAAGGGAGMMEALACHPLG